MKNTNKLKTIGLSLIVMALWGSLFPFIKIGYKAFDIDATSIPDILMFAGVRFTLCGLVLSVISYVKAEKLKEPKKKNICLISLMGLFSIVLHYAFTYIGLAITESSKTALLKQLGALLYICFAFLFFKNEKFCYRKIVGALVGFVGIIAINLSSVGVNFSVGDLLIIGASICTVIANVISKKAVDGNSAFWVTGISQLVGGLILLAAAFALGADTLVFNRNSTLVFLYICTASMIAYTLWYYILRTNDLSNMFIIKFAEPLFACIFGAILLGENIFKIQYLVAFLLISFGIIIANQK